MDCRCCLKPILEQYKKIYGIIILPVVLYGCETWSLMLREEHRPMVFEKWVLKEILTPRRDDVTEE